MNSGVINLVTPKKDDEVLPEVDAGDDPDFVNNRFVTLFIDELQRQQLAAVAHSTTTTTTTGSCDPARSNDRR